MSSWKSVLKYFGDEVITNQSPKLAEFLTLVCLTNSPSSHSNDNNQKKNFN